MKYIIDAEKLISEIERRRLSKRYIDPEDYGRLIQYFINSGTSTLKAEG